MRGVYIRTPLFSYTPRSTAVTLLSFQLLRSSIGPHGPGRRVRAQDLKILSGPSTFPVVGESVCGAAPAAYKGPVQG